MRAKRILTGAALAVSLSACTSQEVAFWQAWHAADPRAAETFLVDAGVPAGIATAGDAATRIEAPEPAETPALRALSIVVGLNSTSLAYSASAECPGTLHLTNTSDRSYTYLVQYGPSQMPIVHADASGDYPTLPVGASVSIDLTAALAAGWHSNVFLDRGRAFDVVGVC